MMEVNDAQTAQSGVRVSTSTRGFDIAVHAYVGCTREQMEAAGDVAMQEYMRVFSHMKETIEGAFALEVAKRKPAA